MNRNEFTKELKALLHNLPRSTINSYVEYYNEIILDVIESGLTEADAIANLGDIDIIAQNILNENKSINKKADCSLILLFTVILSSIVFIVTCIFIQPTIAFYNIHDLSLIIGIISLILFIQSKAIGKYYAITTTFLLVISTFLRFLPNNMFVSLIMNEPITFWGINGALLIYWIFIGVKKTKKKLKNISQT